MAKKHFQMCLALLASPQDFSIMTLIPGDGTCDCIDPDFKPINCPTNTDPTLPTHDDFFGDNICDGHLNTKENYFDGGDCCGKEVNTDYCYPEVGDNCDCIDPNFKP